MDWLVKKEIYDANDEAREWRVKYESLKTKADALCEAAKDASAELDGEGYAKQSMRIDQAIAAYEEARHERQA